MIPPNAEDLHFGALEDASGYLADAAHKLSARPSTTAEIDLFTAAFSVLAAISMRLDIMDDRDRRRDERKWQANE